MMKKKMMSAGGNMKKKGYAGGGVGMKKGYAAGGMPMAKDPKTGKMMPKFAMDGVGKMAKGGNAMKKKGYSVGGTTAAKKKKLMAARGTLGIPLPTIGPRRPPRSRPDKSPGKPTRPDKSPGKPTRRKLPGKGALPDRRKLPGKGALPDRRKLPGQPMRPKSKTMTPAEKMFMEGYKKGMRDAQSKGVTASKGASMEKKK